MTFTYINTHNINIIYLLRCVRGVQQPYLQLQVYDERKYSTRALYMTEGYDSYTMRERKNITFYAYIIHVYYMGTCENENACDNNYIIIIIITTAVTT